MRALLAICLLALSPALTAAERVVSLAPESVGLGSHEAGVLAAGEAAPRGDLLMSVRGVPGAARSRCCRNTWATGDRLLPRGYKVHQLTAPENPPHPAR